MVHEHGGPSDAAVVVFLVAVIAIAVVLWLLFHGIHMGNTIVSPTATPGAGAGASVHASALATPSAMPSATGTP